MDNAIFEETLKIIDPIAKESLGFLEPPTNPSMISPFTYVGIGDFPIEHKSFDLDILHFIPTLPTMAINAKRDLITGEIISYENLPISTDENDPNRQIGSIESYHKGSIANSPLYPISSQQYKSDNIDFNPYIDSLDTGMNLLVDPFSNEHESSNKDEIDQLPSLPLQLSIGEATIVPNPRIEYKNDQISSQFNSILDTFDTSTFDRFVPKMACTFNYKLDDFQLRSIYRLENHECVFVSAPTSAGKTVIARYAIALCRNHGMRAIYTSPIKALSNQKYREFSIQFGEKDVGILTGDVSINREASVLIMTTEILRSMLYKGADILRDVECVIFDECHYISDEERGVVWEESIILMPPSINMAFLSATIPNSEELSSWIARTKGRDVYVEIHDKRPVPLNHSLYYLENIYKIVDSSKEINGRPIFDDSEFDKAAQKMENYTKKFREYLNPMDSPYYWSELILNLKKRNLLPALMFTFSIKKIDEYAQLARGTNLLTKEEKNYVVKFFYKTIRRLPEDDRNLPQVNSMFELLKCGIGIHHSGLLQILKETVEILLADGYLKVIFCTSSVGMGINVPVRTCCFTSLKKYSKKNGFTEITQTEYLQMSGRAGRRGLDDVGNAVICVGKKLPDRSFLYKLFFGSAERVESKFYLKFSMILRLVCQRALSVSDFLKRSLSANSINLQIPVFKERINELQEKLKQIDHITDCPFVESIENNDIEDIECGTPINDFVTNVNKLCDINKSIININQKDFINAIKEGMIVLFTNKEKCQLAVVGQIENQQNEENVNNFPKISLVLSNGSSLLIKKAEDLNSLHLLTSSVTNNVDSFEPESIKSLINSLDINEQVKAYNEFIKNKSIEFFELANSHHDLILKIINSKCFKCSSLSSHYPVSKTAHLIRKLIKENNQNIKDEKIQLIPLTQCYLNMLENMNYISNHNHKSILNLKGRIAMTVKGHEIISTELLVNGFFDDCSPEEIAALSSCLVCEDLNSDKESDGSEDLLPNLQDKLNQMKEVAQYVEEMMIENAVPFDENNFFSTVVNPLVLKAIYLWACGEHFEEVIRQSPEILEGKLIGVINKLQNLLTSFASAAKLMGTKYLCEKFEMAKEAIKRDIIYTGSLYLD